MVFNILLFISKHVQITALKYFNFHSVWTQLHLMTKILNSLRPSDAYMRQ